MSMYILKNSVRHYAWGGRKYIPSLLGVMPAPDTPYAELWMGAHPNAPSRLLLDAEGGGDSARTHSLYALVADNPQRWVGDARAKAYGGDFPFLFKVLSIDMPLSIQVHPNSDQAAAGYAAEERRGIARESPTRMYKDARHKPELLCALTPCWAICGFRPPEEIAREFALPPYRNLRDGVRAPIRAETLFPHLLTLNRQREKRRALLRKCARHITSTYPHLHTSIDAATPSPEAPPIEIAYWWVLKLLRYFPDDIGALAPLYMNVIFLRPTEGLYIGAETIHAYLHGNGIEIMANSDNVLRCGLTVKHVDADELLKIVNMSHSEYRIIHGTLRECIRQYDAPASEFTLCAIHSTSSPATIIHKPLPKICICIDGAATLSTGAQRLSLRRGESLFCEPRSNVITVEGDATLYAALPAGAVECARVP